MALKNAENEIEELEKGIVLAHDLGDEIIAPNGYLVTTNEKVKNMTGFHFIEYYDILLKQ